MPQLITGSDAAKAIDDQAKAEWAASRGIRLGQQKFPDGEEVFLRPFTDHDAWISMGTHNYIPTKARPDAWPSTSNWPPSMWGVCQNHRTFLNRDADDNPIPGDYEEGYGNCWICANLKGQKSGRFDKDLGRPEQVIYGIWVVRQPIMEGSNLVGLKDDTIEIKLPDGTTAMIPHLVLVVQKWSNFYGAVKTASYRDQTVTNKDFVIERNKTDYKISNLGADDKHHPGTDSWKAYEEALALTKFDLGAYLLEHATPDHYKRWFIPGEEPEGGYNSGRSDDSEESGSSSQAAANGSSAPSAPVAPDVDPDALAKFRADLDSRKK